MMGGQTLPGHMPTCLAACLTLLPAVPQDPVWRKLCFCGFREDMAALAQVRQVLSLLTVPLLVPNTPRL